MQKFYECPTCSESRDEATSLWDRRGFIEHFARVHLDGFYLFTCTICRKQHADPLVAALHAQSCKVEYGVKKEVHPQARQLDQSLLDQLMKLDEAQQDALTLYMEKSCRVVAPQAEAEVVKPEPASSNTDVTAATADLASRRRVELMEAERERMEWATLRNQPPPASPDPDESKYIPPPEFIPEQDGPDSGILPADAAPPAQGDQLIVDGQEEAENCANEPAPEPVPYEPSSPNYGPGSEDEAEPVNQLDHQSINGGGGNGDDWGEPYSPKSPEYAENGIRDDNEEEPSTTYVPCSPVYTDLNDVEETRPDSHESAGLAASSRPESAAVEQRPDYSAFSGHYQPNGSETYAPVPPPEFTQYMPGQVAPSRSPSPEGSLSGFHMAGPPPPKNTLVDTWVEELSTRDETERQIASEEPRRSRSRSRRSESGEIKSRRQKKSERRHKKEKHRRESSRRRSTSRRRSRSRSRSRAASRRSSSSDSCERRGGKTPRTPCAGRFSTRSRLDDLSPRTPAKSVRRSPSSSRSPSRPLDRSSRPPRSERRRRSVTRSYSRSPSYRVDRSPTPRRNKRKRSLSRRRDYSPPRSRSRFAYSISPVRNRPSPPSRRRSRSRIRSESVSSVEVVREVTGQPPKTLKKTPIKMNVRKTLPVKKAKTPTPTPQQDAASRLLNRLHQKRVAQKVNSSANAPPPQPVVVVKRKRTAREIRHSLDFRLTKIVKERNKKDLEQAAEVPYAWCPRTCKEAHVHDRASSRGSSAGALRPVECVTWDSPDRSWTRGLDMEKQCAANGIDYEGEQLAKLVEANRAPVDHSRCRKDVFGCFCTYPNSEKYPTYEEYLKARYREFVASRNVIELGDDSEDEPDCGDREQRGQREQSGKGTDEKISVAMRDGCDVKNVHVHVNSQSQSTSICDTATDTTVSNTPASSQDEPAANLQLTGDVMVVREDRLQVRESEPKEHADSRGKMAVVQPDSVATDDSASPHQLVTVAAEAELAAVPAKGALLASLVLEGGLEEAQQHTDPVTSTETTPPMSPVTLEGSSSFIPPVPLSSAQSVTPSLEPVTSPAARPVTPVQPLTSPAAQPEGLSWPDRATLAWTDEVMPVQPVPVTLPETSPAVHSGSSPVRILVGQRAIPVTQRTPTSRFNRSGIHANDLVRMVIPYGRSSLNDHSPANHHYNNGAFRLYEVASPVGPPASHLFFRPPGATHPIFGTPPNRNVWRGHPYPQRPDYGTPRAYWPRGRGGHPL